MRSPKTFPRPARERDRPLPPASAGPIRKEEAMHSTFPIVPSRFRRAVARSLVVLPAILAILALSATGCSKQNVLAPEVAGSAASSLRAGALPTEPLHLAGVMDSGALWAIDRPANWNGELVLYAHGYVNPAEPVAMPNYGAIRDSLLARGYAVAATSYSQNGYASTEGVRETHALKGLFIEQAGKPTRTYLLGRSLGGLIGMLLAQRYPGQYDGGLFAAGVVGGSAEEVQYMSDIRVLFDVMYPGVLKGDLYHPERVTDAELFAKVIAPVMQAIQANPNGVGVIQALTRRPLPGNNAQEIGTSLVSMIVFAVEEGGDFYERSHQLSPFDNMDYHYNSPYVPAQIVDYVNAHVARYSLHPGAWQYVQHWGKPEGPFGFPVITMHTTGDPVVPYFHETNLAAVAAGPNLRQYPVVRTKHDDFTTAEIMARFVELTNWVGSSSLVAAESRGRTSD
jgi:pimeloyl-ACP methyl ester carboxylesterase